VIVPSKESVVIADTEPAIKGVLEHKNVLKGTKIMTTDGRDLGTMVDLYFDEQTGAVEGYEASGGLFAQQSLRLLSRQRQSSSCNAPWIPPTCSFIMSAVSGGTNATSCPILSVCGAGTNDRPVAASAATVDQAKGRRVRRAVRTDQGLIIVPEGQIVTDVVIERVRSHDKEQELLDAVGVERGEAARASASGAMSAASAQLGATAQQAKQGVSDLLGRAKAKMAEIQERTTKESEEFDIKRALGRPVTRVILDRQDNVILNVGELITNEAVERSRQEGVLDILLSSVYDKKPELSTEDLRAPEPGEASLEPRDPGSA
jgi:hypothetical protein